MIATDKLLHLLAGAVITLALGYLLPVWIALIASYVVGFAKEVYDRYHPATNTSDGMDFIFTAAGGALCAVFVTLAPTLKGLI